VISGDALKFIGHEKSGITDGEDTK